jgi:ubiquinone/menaquinone biosynthesis C-methylase UbiE
VRADRALIRTTQRRYDRIASVYDRAEAPIERLFYASWRRRLWSEINGSDVLEVGVGTGKNMPYYPAGSRVVAIDLSRQMLSRAGERAETLHLDVDLRQMDVQDLTFASDSFDAVVGSFVFCSVPDPILGLREVARVCKLEGEIRLLEHMRARNRALGLMMDIVNPLAVRMSGANINRPTVSNVESAGLKVISVEDLAVQGVFRLIVARPTAE